jgi:DNA polymerase-3 subunit beta
MTTTPIETEFASDTATGLHFTTGRQAFAEALLAIAPAVPRRSTLPILHNVLIRVSTLGIRLSVTNLELYATYRVPFSETAILGYGAVTTNYKELVDLVKLMESERLAFSYKEGMLTVEAEGLSAPLETMPAGEYPACPQPKEGAVQSVDLPAPVFRTLVERVAPAAATDESRPVFTSIYMTVKEAPRTLILAGADGFRLHIAQERVEGLGIWERALLIPAVGLREIVKKLPKTGEVLIASSDPDMVMITCGPLTIRSRLTEGTFPNFEFILPKERDITARATVAPVRLVKALKIVEPIAKDASNIIRLHCSGQSIEMSAIRDGMTSPRTVKVQTEIEGDIEINFNYVYLLDMLAAAKAELVEFAFTTYQKPARIYTPGFTGILMPMHVKDRKGAN